MLAINFGCSQKTKRPVWERTRRFFEHENCICQMKHTRTQASKATNKLSTDKGTQLSLNDLEALFPGRLIRLRPGPSEGDDAKHPVEGIPWKTTVVSPKD